MAVSDQSHAKGLLRKQDVRTSFLFFAHVSSSLMQQRRSSGGLHVKGSSKVALHVPRPTRAEYPRGRAPAAACYARSPHNAARNALAMK
jgi:hypothetical protein